MAKTVLLDELLLTFRVPDDRPDAELEAIRRALEGDEFLLRLRRAVRTVLTAFPDLAATRVTLSRCEGATRPSDQKDDPRGEVSPSPHGPLPGGPWGGSLFFTPDAPPTTPTCGRKDAINAGMRV